MADAIIQLVKRQTPIVGICGGYQMMGERLEDPEGIETGGSLRGLGLLPCQTVFEENKTRTRVTGTLRCNVGDFAVWDGCPVEGYEIHMGKTTGRCAAALALSNGVHEKLDGAVSEHAFGCYLHGLFDRHEVVERLVDMLLCQRGLTKEKLALVDSADYKEKQYAKLADIMRHSLDLEAIYRILGLPDKEGKQR